MLPASVETLVLELETRAGKTDQLDAVLRGGCRLGREDGAHLELENAYTSDATGSCSTKEADDSGSPAAQLYPGAGEWRWQGTTVYDGREVWHHPKSPTMEYVVRVLNFRVVKEDKGRGGRPSFWSCVLGR